VPNPVKVQHRDSASVTIGSPAAGVNGFRRSLSQAIAARSVVLARRGEKPTVVADGVAEVLGGLAAETESDARLRDTLRVFLNGGASYTVAAEQLALHSSTVKYRVGRAMARRGMPITDDRFDVVAEIAQRDFSHRGGRASDTARLGPSRPYDGMSTTAGPSPLT
jgi:sugar diacid utilization regulator